MMIPQKLPIAYGTTDLLTAALTHVLGNDDFEIDGVSKPFRRACPVFNTDSAQV